jgi:hypothetical protein
VPVDPRGGDPRARRQPGLPAACALLISETALSDV